MIIPRSNIIKNISQKCSPRENSIFDESLARVGRESSM